MFLSKIVSSIAIFIYGVQAGLNMAKCAAGFDWNKNTLGQDPCTVGSMLDASCRGLVEYIYPPLNRTQYYPPPSANNLGDVTCDCNTVMYSLYIACASCQGGQIYSWTQWMPQCDEVYVTQYPGYLAQRTAVPLWAYYDVTLLPNQTWSDAVAISIGQGPQELLGRQVSSLEPSTLSPGSPTTTTSRLPFFTKVPGKSTSVRNLGQPSGSSSMVPTPTDSPVGSTPTDIPIGSTPAKNMGRSNDSDSRVSTTTNSQGTTTTTPTRSPQSTNINNQNGGTDRGAIFGTVSSVVPLTILALLVFL